jgi:hypothetical protein
VLGVTVLGVVLGVSVRGRVLRVRSGGVGSVGEVVVPLVPVPVVWAWPGAAPSSARLASAPAMWVLIDCPLISESSLLAS